MFLFFSSYHDSRDSRWDSPVKELEGVVRNLLRSGPILGLSSWSNHAGLQENTLKQHIVLSKVEENLSPHLLRYFECPVNAMFTIKQDLWLYNGDQPVLLIHRITQKTNQSL